MKTESILLHTRNTSQPQRQTSSQSKGLRRKIFQTNGPKKQAGVAILIPKKRLQTKINQKRQKRHFILVTGKIYQE